MQEVAPALDRAARLTAAMHAGKIGEWWWDQRSGKVGWNDQLASLFGTDPAEFEGTFDAWVARIDERDRDMVLAAVQDGVARGESFRFDHRCIWPDGSLHWIEGIGEVTIGRDGQRTGASGLAFDVDERHRELDERAHLVEVEHRARLRAEYLARVHGVLSTSLDVDGDPRTRHQRGGARPGRLVRGGPGRRPATRVTDDRCCASRRADEGLGTRDPAAVPVRPGCTLRRGKGHPHRRARSVDRAGVVPRARGRDAEHARPGRCEHGRHRGDRRSAWVCWVRCS